MSVRIELAEGWSAPLKPAQLIAALNADWQPEEWGGAWTALRKAGLGGRERWRWQPPMSQTPDGQPPMSQPPEDPTPHGQPPDSQAPHGRPNDAAPPLLYVKRYRRTPLALQWDRFWRQAPWRSRAWWEFRCSDELARKYVPAVRAVAAVERMVGCWEAVSLAVFAPAPGAPLDALLAEAQRGDRPAVRGPARRDLARRLGRFVSAFHQSGLCHRDLYLCHIFAELDPDARQPPRFTLIDLGRVLRPRWRRLRWLVKDLAQLDSSARPLGATRTDRLRFLLAYLGLQPGAPRTRLYARRIVRKGDAILRRELRRAARRESVRSTRG